MLTFPTRPDRACQPGMPFEADPCHCDDPIFDLEGGCHRCGHYLEDTIRDTWAERARVVARRHPQHSLAA